MTERLFWEMNPNKMKPYYKAYELSRKNRIEEKNYLNYLQGVYFVDALRATVGNMFSKKGSTPYEYPEEPYKIFRKEEKPVEQTKQEAREEAIAFLNRFASNRGKRVKDV